jgi:ketosteroid isomerase-like protein
MSQENVEIVRLSFEAVSRRDKAAFLALCDPEVKTVPLRDFPESAPTRGVEAVWDLFVELQGSWRKGALKPVELIEAGADRVVAHAYGEMLGEASGATVAASVWSVVTFGNRKMLRIDWFAERAEALDAAGLSEQDAHADS